MPRLLPKDHLSKLLCKKRLALCLDYDGTIAPITSNPEEALPTAEIRDLIVALTRRPERVLMAIASGRRAKEVKALLAVEGPLAVVGMHGLEVIDWEGERRITSPTVHCRPALDKARIWLNTIAGSRQGFFVEDKGLAFALHYRRANWNEAAVTIDRLRMLVNNEAPELEMIQGDLVVELVPRVAPDKGFAFLSLAEANGRCMPVYFSDDPGDEGAFYKLRRYGITVLVGPERQSCAEYRVEDREGLTRVLSTVAEAVAA
jgi:trehalose 6-phosphate phosphatase